MPDYGIIRCNKSRANEKTFDCMEMKCPHFDEEKKWCKVANREVHDWELPTCLRGTKEMQEDCKKVRKRELPYKYPV